jgi:MoxR-like ATPase
VYVGTGKVAQEIYSDLYDKAMSDPASLAVFMNAIKQVQTNAVSQVQPVRIPSVVSSFTPVEPEVVEEEVVAVVEAPTPPPVERDEPMAFAPTTQQNTTDAVLTVPPIKEYYDREYFGIPVMTIIDDARANQENVLFTGPAGTGKTSCAEYYAATRNLPFVTIECTQQIDQGITQGRFVPTGIGNSTKWRYSQLATAIQQPSVILINELTRMTPKAASLFLRLLQERELVIEPLNEVIKVHPEVLFIADQNTGMGYTGTSRQDAALIDRFNIKLEFQYDTNIESKFISSPTLLTFAGNIREAAELNDEFSVPMSTRILKNFVAQAKRLNFEFAVNSLLSNYPKMDGERDAIKMRFDADASAIADELQVALGKYVTA